jgi:hypothetical protein
MIFLTEVVISRSGLTEVLRAHIGDREVTLTESIHKLLITPTTRTEDLIQASLKSIWIIRGQTVVKKTKYELKNIRRE